MKKIVGVLFAFGGCFFMVYESGVESTPSPTIAAWVPNLLFFGNCLGTPFYVLTTKSLLEDYPPLWITAWACT